MLICWGSLPWLRGQLLEPLIWAQKQQSTAHGNPHRPRIPGNFKTRSSPTETTPNPAQIPKPGFSKKKPETQTGYRTGQATTQKGIEPGTLGFQGRWAGHRPCTHGHGHGDAAGLATHMCIPFSSVRYEWHSLCVVLSSRRTLVYSTC